MKNKPTYQDLEQRIKDLEKDASDRKQLADALRQSEEKYRGIFDESLAAIYLFDINKKFIDTNQAGCDLLGYSREELLCLSISDVDADPVIVKPAHAQLLSGQRLVQYEHQLKKIDGSIISVLNNSRPIIDTSGNTVGLQSTLIDITESRKAQDDLQLAHDELEKQVGERTASLSELNNVLMQKIEEQEESKKALASSEEQYRTLVNNLPLGIFRTTLDGEFASVNPALVEMLGYDNLEDLLAVPVEKIYSDPKFREQLLEQLQASKVISNFEIEACCRDGSHILISTSIRTETDEHGNILFLDGIGEDITEQKRLEKELSKSRQLESLGLLAGGIAHDFNNILTAVLGNVSLAKILPPDDPNFNDILTEAEKASFRAKDLTQKLLTFAKGGEPVLQTISLANVIKESANFVLSGSKVACCYDFSDDLWMVDVDKSQISQVIQNLIINARQAMPEGGNIQVKCLNYHRDELGFSQQLPPGKYIQVSIQDEGIGVSPRHIEKIFDPYFTTKQMGNGLGLAITHSIIKKHGGYIIVSSELGKGTLFSFFLPASIKLPRQEMKKEQELVNKKGKILIMDDDKNIRVFTEKVLSYMACEFVLVEDGSEAIEFYSQAMADGEPFDAVVLDLTIPGGMGGEETVKRLIKMDPSVRAIVISGYSNDPVMMEHEKYGFKEKVIKPFRIEELSEALQKVLV
jgi:PAS domain S-box-containing protein